MTQQRPLQVGDAHRQDIRFSAEQGVAFAAVTGDDNPIHRDAAFAAQSRFGRPIAHGMLAASEFSRVLGMVLPGPGTIYLSQQLSFKRPIYYGETYALTVEVITVDGARHRAQLRTVIADSAGKVVIDGEAQVMHEQRICSPELDAP